MPFNPASSYSFNPRAKGDEAPGDTAEAKKILTVKEQYADGRYADFVEAKRNAPFYKYYLHYTLMKHIEDGYENTILHVTNLTKNVNKGILEEIFGNYGKVKDVELGIDEKVKLPLGYAFVEMEDKDGAEKALKYMDSGQIDGNKLRVKYKLVANSRRSPDRGRRERSPNRRAPQRRGGGGRSPPRRRVPVRRSRSPRRGPRRGRSPPRRGGPRRRSPRRGRSPVRRPRRSRSRGRGRGRQPRRRSMSSSSDDSRSRSRSGSDSDSGRSRSRS
mmetsp:Transcript_33046/g.53652  ORF Transcript_33046/g.53652 Transcript_33046/m.53652 type:complete len:273 (+) Transcript_33046:112-930(+)